MTLNRNFYKRDTLEVAKDLLGKVICRKTKEGIIRGRIVETEAYIGEDDQACHARFGKTKRNKPMYGEPGHAYIYLCYGIHNLLNIVTEGEDKPAAVLIRKVEPVGDRRGFDYFGPGNLTKFFKIDRSLNGVDVTQRGRLWIEDGYEVPRDEVKSAKRVGVEYAGEYADLPWRFML